MSNQLEPLHDFVIIEMRKPDEKSLGGIILPDRAKELQQVGIVIAVGPGREKDDGTLCKMHCQVGDEVVFYIHQSRGREVEYEGKKVLVMLDREIIARRAK